MSASTIEGAVQTWLERDPLLPRSQSVGYKTISLSGSLRYHPIHNNRGRWYLCGCMPAIRGVTGFSRLARGRRRDYRWADRYRCYGRLPDRKDRW